MNSTLEDRIRATIPEHVTDPDVDRLLQAGRRRRRVKRAAAAGGSAVVVIGVVTALTGLPTGTPTVEPLTPPAPQPATPAATTAPAWAPEVVEAAAATPRLLVTEPGWEISSAMFASGIVDDREIDFENGDQQVELRWTVGDFVDEIVADLTQEGLAVEQTMVLGHDASLLSMPTPSAEPSPGTVLGDASADEQAHVAVFFDGEFTIELVAVVPARSDFLDLVESLEQVDVETWLSALPDQEIPVADREAFVADVLADVPTPPGFDGAGLAAGPLEHPYQLTARVIGQLSCSWIANWVTARADEDETTAQAAADAMAAVAQSEAVDRLAAQGGFGGVVQDYAEAIATDGTVVGGRVLDVEDSYEDALGC